VTDHRERLLEEDTAAWGTFAQAVILVPAAERAERTLTPEGWSVTTAVVHVAAWLEECARVLEAMAAGTWDPASEPEETPEYVREVNRGHDARAAAMTTSDADLAVAAARERARRAFTALPDVTPDAISWFQESGPLHYAKHEADIRAWLGGVRHAGSS
jgi:hypothetical protein